MNTTINSDLIRGNINTIILKALYEGDRYGYDIIKEIEQKSSGQYVLKQPTLYSCLKRLEVQGFIRSYWGAKSNGGRRKYYTLTDMGRELFLKNQSEWEYSRTVIDRLISDREADLTDADRAYIAKHLQIDASSNTQSTDVQKMFDEETYDSLEESTESESVGEVETADSNTAESQVTEESESQSQLSESELAILNTIDSDSDNEPEPDINELKELYRTARPMEQEPPTPEVDPVQQQREYTDTSKLLDKLFSQEEDDSDDNSYAQKLAADSYEAIPQKKSDESNFGSFHTSSGQEDRYVDTNYNSHHSYDDEYGNDYDDDDSDSFAPLAPVPPAPIFNPPAPQESDSGFLRYDTKLEHIADDKHAIVKRDYKSVLGRLVANQTTAIPEAAPVETKPAVIPPSKEMALAEEATDKLLNPLKNSRDDLQPAEQKYNDISSSFRELGDNICVREHSLAAAREHESKLYFYPYRLMRTQYLILMGIMFAMIAATFLVVRVGYQIISTRDIWVYSFAIALAVILPITGAILDFRNQGKKMRIQYNFKTSLVYRLILLAGCLVLTYCVNIYLEMPPMLSINYLCSLLLPFLFSLCLPINTIIFNSLFNSGKYSA